MQRVVFALLAFSVVAARNVTAQQKTTDGETTVIKAPTQTELLLKQLRFSRETTRIIRQRTKTGLPDYSAAINEHYDRGVTPEKKWNRAAVRLI